MKGSMRRNGCPIFVLSRGFCGQLGLGYSGRERRRKALPCPGHGRRRRRRGRCSADLFTEEFQADDAGDDKGDTGEAGGGGAFVEEENARDGGADGADAGPHGIGGADGESAGGEGEEGHARSHRGPDTEARPEAREAVGEFKAGGPDDFEGGGEEQERPVHGRERGARGGRVNARRASYFAQIFYSR